MTTTLPADLRARRDGEPAPDLTDYAVVHRAMRIDVHRLAGAAREIARGTGATRARAKALREYIGPVFGEILSHHHVEDEFVWPALERITDGGAALDGLTGDHQALDPLLERGPTLARRLVADPSDRACAGELADVLDTLSALLDAHIDDEEREIFPLIERHMRSADYEWLQARFRGSLRPSLLPFVVPWVLRHATDDERERMLGEAPGMFAVLLRLFRPGFARRERVLFG